MNQLSKNRIESIDILRGIVMIIMALDHVRDYFHFTANLNDPLDLATTSPVLFFTRWITHFCAPVFVFLSGTSIYLQALRKTKSELSAFLFKRGLWLIILEVGIVTFGWSFNPAYNTLFLQVIWAIGISMILLGFLMRLPFKMILVLGLIIVFGHNILDFYETEPGFHASFFSNLLHHGKFVPYQYAENHSILMVYPFLPWTGLMMLGYCCGKLFSPTVSSEERRRKLSMTGISLILFFIVLRFANVYGDPVPWTHQHSGLFTFLSFMDVYKYPPSLLYLCITIGPALLALAWLEKFKNKFTAAIKVYGRVALFYYVLHIYLIHVFSAITFFMRGHHMSEAFDLTAQSHFPFYFLIPGEGVHLPVVYLVWLALIVMLYPLCKWYDRYKTNHKEKWWLSYL